MNGKLKKGNAPILRVKMFPVTVAVWENESLKGAGKYFTYSLQRSYKDDAGNYQNTESLRQRDLLVAAECLREAFKQTIGRGVVKEE